MRVSATGWRSDSVWVNCLCDLQGCLLSPINGMSVKGREVAKVAKDAVLHKMS